MHTLHLLKRLIFKNKRKPLLIILVILSIYFCSLNSQFPSIKRWYFVSMIERPIYNINCDRILEADKQEILFAQKLLNNTPYKILNDTNFIFENNNCELFRKYRLYDSYKISEIERNFPLAYNILTYENADQFERLLNRIYRSHNIYCIHVDAKSPQSFKKAIQSIVDCFDNVFIATKLETIVYAGYSRLQADINCMNDLVNKTYLTLNKKNVYWKYLINLASTEYPLKTNYEIVKILKLYNGANDIEVSGKINVDRFKYIYENYWNNKTNQTDIHLYNDIKNNPPHNFTIRKGSAYGSFSYEFVKWIVTNQYSKDLLKWKQDIYSPDES
jgi:hypothetical protein